MRGYDIVAKSLAAQGIQHAYGIVGEIYVTQEFQW
jgi:thiamine pyrophosphate-dependent acetolactate synthase large subunit-like protein